MSSGFPYILDSFTSPSGSNHLSDIVVLHSLQHTNLNDGMAAVQARIGVVSSSITNSIDYELHNIYGGHNHDGVNSRQIAIGPPPYGGVNYVGGIFPFSASTDIGTVVNAFNTFFVSASSKPEIKVNEISFGTPNTINFTGSYNVVSGSLSGSQLNVTIDALTERSRRLILLAGCDGPYESYTSSYRTIGYLNGTSIYPTASIWFEDSSLAKKIVSHVVDYNSRHQITKSTWTVYDVDGVTPLYTSIDIIGYSGLREISRQRTII